MREASTSSMRNSKYSPPCIPMTSRQKRHENREENRYEGGTLRQLDEHVHCCTFL